MSKLFQMRLHESQWVRMDANESEHVQEPWKTGENFEKPRKNFEKLHENFENFREKFSLLFFREKVFDALAYYLEETARSLAKNNRERSARTLATEKEPFRAAPQFARCDLDTC